MRPPPSLHELALAAILKNQNQLSFLPLMPPSEIRPILDGLTLDNLKRVWELNPHLSEHDFVWSKFCYKHFNSQTNEYLSKNAAPDSWSKLFYRFEKEREFERKRIFTLSRLKQPEPIRVVDKIVDSPSKQTKIVREHGKMWQQAKKLTKIRTRRR
ncbi:hypothetical protein RCL1_007444 [Eukaryota sp. TZLM3-RCL]